LESSDAWFVVNEPGSGNIDKLPDALALLKLSAPEPSPLKGPQLDVFVVRSEASGPEPVHVASTIIGNVVGSLGKSGQTGVFSSITACTDAPPSPLEMVNAFGD